tara:strand:+ start:23701 stop:24276 length:576 start_codon:yes stop_codon:yes gene_type:complete
MAWKEIPTNDNVNDYYMQWSARLYFRGGSQGQTIWNFPSVTYGPNYYQWSSYAYSGVNLITGLSVDSNDGLGNWLAGSSYAYNPCIVVPSDGTVKKLDIRFNMLSAERVTFILGHGSPNWGGIGATPTIDKLGSGNSVVTTAHNYYKSEETFTDSVSAGDILIPQWKKTTNMTSTATKYAEAVVTITLTKE